MAVWIVLVIFVPIVMIESVWSDFQSVQETIENRLDAATKHAGLTEMEKTK
jgi:hypothetical protein